MREIRNLLAFARRGVCNQARDRTAQARVHKGETALQPAGLRQVIFRVALIVSMFVLAYTIVYYKLE